MLGEFNIAHNLSKDKAIFLNCKLWSPSEFHAKVLKKGSQVVLTGEIIQERYPKADGSKGEKVYIRVNKLQFFNTSGIKVDDGMNEIIEHNSEEVF